MSVDRDFLSQIVAATAADTAIYVGQVMGQPMLAHNPPLIEINADIINPANPTEVLCRALPAANDFLATPEAAANSGNSDTPKYAILSGVTLPAAKKRGNTGNGGAPTKYPFASLEVGQTFFSGNSEHNKRDAVKALGSTVSAQNDKHSVQKMENGVGVTKTVTRAVRDPVTKKAQIGPDGKKVTETVQLPVKEYEKKFTIRPVQKGFASGGWTAPEDGALVGRIK